MTSLCAAARAPPALAASASARLPRSSRRSMVVCAAQGEQAASQMPAHGLSPRARSRAEGSAQ